MHRTLAVVALATTLGCGGQAPSGPADVPSTAPEPAGVPAPDGYLWRLLTGAAPFAAILPGRVSCQWFVNAAHERWTYDGETSRLLAPLLLPGPLRLR